MRTAKGSVIINDAMVSIDNFAQLTTVSKRREWKERKYPKSQIRASDQSQASSSPVLWMLPVSTTQYCSHNNNSSNSNSSNNQGVGDSIIQEVKN
mmetsp:Transcript_32284/g.37008  ORF Transcript_32284/g.37008 Transcript_32284/m.37008 type:complete len:95 (+) Transcript_32284:204-488(+)